MDILLTNDDGVQAPTLWALEKSLGQLGNVTVVAPRNEQSGVGHAITYRTPITAQRIERENACVAHAVDGTPADCVKFGILQVLGQRPDVIVSGINPGLNVGCNVFYSGTVAAALEGALYGVLSVALSCDVNHPGPVEWLSAQAVRSVQKILELPVEHPLAYNVNLPHPDGQRPRIAFTHHWPEAFQERYVPENREGTPGYRLDLPWEDQVPPAEHCDVLAVRDGMISITPMRPSLTDHESLRRLQASG